MQSDTLLWGLYEHRTYGAGFARLKLSEAYRKRTAARRFRADLFEKGTEYRRLVPVAEVWPQPARRVS